ncbi:hypothetical protein AAG565_13015 [Fontimonas sp. SYSU GA230001]|uniref:hypothetical protein n=1 Tax=Fontimonas sp. SYSU GA230001 TaxID=3142450 RepID=UPI0032B551A7
MNPSPVVEVETGGSAPELSANDVRIFLEGLRNRVLRVTTGMRPGSQRLELAIEAFWYAALEATAAVGAIPWRRFTRPDHALRSLLGPIRIMLRSELINSGLPQPDALCDDALGRMLEVAEAESATLKCDPQMREDFRTWLRGRLRAAGYLPASAMPLSEAA